MINSENRNKTNSTMIETDIHVYTHIEPRPTLCTFQVVTNSVITSIEYIFYIQENNTDT